MKYLILLLLASSPFIGLQAQQPDSKRPSIPYTDECLLNTTETMWTSMGLSPEQIEEVMAIQTLCETDRTALQESGEKDPELAQAMLEKHRENVREVLSEEQFDKWQKWCDKRPAKG